MRAYSAFELKKNKTLHNPPGVKNLEHVVAATGTLMASVAMEIISKQNLDGSQ